MIQVGDKCSHMRGTKVLRQVWIKDIDGFTAKARIIYGPRRGSIYEVDVRDLLHVGTVTAEDWERVTNRKGQQR